VLASLSSQSNLSPSSPSSPKSRVQPDFLPPCPPPVVNRQLNDSFLFLLLGATPSAPARIFSPRKIGFRGFLNFFARYPFTRPPSHQCFAFVHSNGDVFPPPAPRSVTSRFFTSLWISSHSWRNKPTHPFAPPFAPRHKLFVSPSFPPAVGSLIISPFFGYFFSFYDFGNGSFCSLRPTLSAFLFSP